MKKFRKVLLFLFLLFVVTIFCFTAYACTATKNVKLDENKLQKNANIVQFLAADGTKLQTDSVFVPLAEMPAHLPQAFIAVEDKRFYSHHGVDYKRILGATAKNLLSFSLKEGASTITQQLIKNTHLTGEKTFRRKLVEAKLAKKLEKKHSKAYILECYLNTIYFGNGAYGVGQAARHYFDKTVKELSLEESATLAAIIKAPAYYSPTASLENSTKRRNIVLKLMAEQNFISDTEYQTACATPLQTITQKKDFSHMQYLKLANQELEQIKQKKGLKQGNLIVKTYLNTKLQNALINPDDLPTGVDLVSQIAISNATGGVVCYKGNVGEICRSPGSTLKPLLVYAPCIEKDIISPSTLLLDEKTNFNGYAPSNYKNQYFGYVSAKFALSHSLNVPSVKLMQYLGTKNAMNYAKKLDIPVKKEDESLALALGVLTDGVTLRTLTGAYTVFSNDGEAIKSAFIKEIYDENGKLIYVHKPQKSKVFSKETAFLTNQMTKDTISSGTLKRLSDKKEFLYGKSGTVGTSEGNSDAYAVTYSKEYTLGIWLGAERGIMKTDVTGGGYPAIYSNLFWEKAYQNATPSLMKKPDEIEEKNIDKYEYETNHKVLLAHDFTPKNEIITEYYKKTSVPTQYSTRFMQPKIENIELSVNNDGILISLCQTHYLNYKLFRQEDNQKIVIYDGKEPRYLDTNVINGDIYQYSILPYVILSNGEKIYGEEVIIGKIKYLLTPPENWWEDFI